MCVHKRHTHERGCSVGRVGQDHIYTYGVDTVCLQQFHQIYRVGQNHTYTVYIRYFWLGNHQICGVYIRIYTVLANPTNIRSYTACINGPGQAQVLSKLRICEYSPHVHIVRQEWR